MAKKALILNNEIVDVVTTEFEVAPTMTWIDCPDDCKVGGWELDGSGNPVEKAAPVDNRTWEEKRFGEYPTIRNQLDMIYHNGDGGATFQAAIKAVKDKYPKP
jgi:hypothetical protein